MNRLYRSTKKICIRIPVPLPTENEVLRMQYAKHFWRGKKYRDLLDLFVSSFIRFGKLSPETLVPYHTRLFSIQSLVAEYSKTIIGRSSRKSFPRIPLARKNIQIL